MLPFTPVLMLAALLPTAEAGTDTWITGRMLHTVGDSYAGGHAERAMVTTQEEGSTTVASVEVDLSSDGGDETVPLVETNAWLHGTAGIKALPAKSAAVTLTLFTEENLTMVSFSGTLGHDGALVMDSEGASESAEAESSCSTKSGCGSGTTTSKYDVDFVGGETSADVVGYLVGVDLAGADTYAVAYAELTVDGATSEVDWDAVGAVWEGETTVAHEGVIDIKVAAYDNDGKKIDKAKIALAEPWFDGGDGTATVATDEDPLTSVGLLEWNDTDVLVVTSSGWTAGDTLPTRCQVALDGGVSFDVAVNSYQRRGRWDGKYGDGKQPWSWSDASAIIVTGGSVTFSDSARRYTDGSYLRADQALSVDNFQLPLCADGLCVQLVEDAAGERELSVVSYTDDGNADDAELVVTAYDKAGRELGTDTLSVSFDDEVTAVFATTVEFAADPVGADLAGKVSLLAPADEKGKSSTLAKGEFAGRFLRDDDGYIELAGVDKDAVSIESSVLEGGTSLTFEYADDDGDGIVLPPPVVQEGNSQGTKNSSSQASTKPELL